MNGISRGPGVHRRGFYHVFLRAPGMAALPAQERAGDKPAVQPAADDRRNLLDGLRHSPRPDTRHHLECRDPCSGDEHAVCQAQVRTMEACFVSAITAEFAIAVLYELLLFSERMII